MDLAAVNAVNAAVTTTVTAPVRADAVTTAAISYGPFAVRLVPLVVLLALGIALAVVGWRGYRGELAFRGRLGVRTAAAARSPETFRLANRVAGLPSLVAGAVAVVCGVAAFVMPNMLGTVLCAAIGLIGGVLIARARGVAGSHAAAAMSVAMSAAERTNPSPGCAGCDCGAGGCAGQSEVCEKPDQPSQSAESAG